MEGNQERGDSGPGPGPGPGRPDEIVVDARGLLCPLPVIRLGERISAVSAGGTLLLLADDPAAEEDVRLWCRGHGHEVAGVERDGREVRIRVRRRGPPSRSEIAGFSG